MVKKEKLKKKAKLKQCFLRKTMSPQPSSFVGYIENYGIKFTNSWICDKRQYLQFWTEQII